LSYAGPARGTRAPAQVSKAGGALGELLEPQLGACLRQTPIGSLHHLGGIRFEPVVQPE